MRHIKLPILLLCAIASVFVACRKELNVPLTDQLAQASLVKSRACAYGVKYDCGMLSFFDQDHFEQTYNCLEAAYEAHLDAFETTYGSLDEDGFNDTADILGFVEEEPLVQFEAVLSFLSYRSHFASLEDAWLANGAPDNDIPMLDDVFNDNVMATLFNKDGAVMIGGYINYYAPSGELYLISDHNCELYDCILVDPDQCDLEGVHVKKSSHLHRFVDLIGQRRTPHSTLKEIEK